MAKNKKQAANRGEDKNFPLFLDDLYDDYESNEIYSTILTNMVEATNNQMNIAVELTKLVSNTNNSSTLNEEKIFSIFQKAMHVIGTCSPLKKIWEEHGSEIQ